MADDGPVDPDGSGEAVDSTAPAWGSDYVVDLLDALGFEFAAFNPGASFRGLEESIINYNDNHPTVIEVPNEGLAVSIAHGYAKATGEPGLCVLHDVVGTMNAAMSLYNAYIDRVPILVLSGTGPMRKSGRRPWIDWIHTANVQGNIVRDYVKWDDQPHHLDGVAESILRAYHLADTCPKGPTYVTLDHDIQESPLETPRPPPDPGDYPSPTRMAPDPAAIERAAGRLVEADHPVVVVDHLGDDRGAVAALVELSERLGAPVLDLHWARFNFPNTHPMYRAESDEYLGADVLLALDVWDIDWLTIGQSTSVSEATDRSITIIDIGTQDVGASGLFPNTYRLHDADLPILADTALAVPALRDAVNDRLDADEEATRRAEARFEAVASRHDSQREQWREAAAEQWEETPVAPARLAVEVWEVIEDDDWVLVNDMFPRWADRLWQVESFEQYIGGSSGGGGVGYGIGAAIGAAIAVRETDRVPVNLQADGDLMQQLGALWVLGHYDIPLLTVMHNNRSMYNSTNHRVQLAEHRGRDASLDRALIGTGYRDPTPDYARVAESLGVSGYGPVEEPDELGAVLEIAWADVKAGTPALVDVVCQPR